MESTEKQTMGRRIAALRRKKDDPGAAGRETWGYASGCF